MKDRCDLCGKFRKTKDLIGIDNGYDEVTGEYETWVECKDCCSQIDHDRFFKKQGENHDI